jgi:hypothetical protein
MYVCMYCMHVCWLKRILDLMTPLDITFPTFNEHIAHLSLYINSQKYTNLCNKHAPKKMYMHSNPWTLTPSLIHAETTMLMALSDNHGSGTPRSRFACVRGLHPQACAVHAFSTEPWVHRRTAQTLVLLCGVQRVSSVTACAIIWVVRVSCVACSMGEDLVHRLALRTHGLSAPSRECLFLL